MQVQVQVPRARSLLALYRPPALPVLRMPVLQPPVCRPPERRPPERRQPVRRPPLSAALVPALRIWTTARSRRHRRQAQRPQLRQRRSAPTCGPAARLRQAQTAAAMMAALRAWRSSMPGQGPDQAVAQVAPAFPVRSPVPAQAQARLPGPEQLPPPESSILQARTRALAPALVPAQEPVQAQPLVHARQPAQAHAQRRAQEPVLAQAEVQSQERIPVPAQAPDQSPPPPREPARTKVPPPLLRLEAQPVCRNCGRIWPQEPVAHRTRTGCCSKLASDRCRTLCKISHVQH
ncbi:UNVERIFIED_ORG: hypothetical protein JN05_05270 [Zoogloea ramigera]